MTMPLSTNAESFIAKLIADGMFTSREAVLERGIAAFREQLGDIPEVPPEHMDAVEAGLEDLRTNGSVEFNAEDRERIKAKVLARLEAERTKAAG